MNNFQDIINSGKPTLVDMFATWCGPCKMMHPILEEVKQHLGERATIIKVDIDQNEALARQLGIQSVPTLLIYKNGAIVWRTVGVQSASTLIQALESFM
ncbi:MAG: thioredoxin [Muribaculaceae bacterium]|nr:thioredoxin [Muribaculaceae bacterium]